jgi:two-component system, OmpR family, response regulator
MTAKGRLLIVDDDPEIRDLLAHFLRRHGFEVALAANSEEMDQQLAASQFDLLVLDVMLPGEDGLSVCRRLSGQTDIPIIMLTAMGEEADRIVGLEMGADDYLAKPFNPRELLARIKAVLRRADPPRRKTGNIVCFENWELDLGKRILKKNDGTLVPLSAGEFSLLQVLSEHPQQVLSRDFLLDRTRGRESVPFDRSVDIQLSRLRRKLEDNPREPALIKTVRSGGYVFCMPTTRR